MTMLNHILFVEDEADVLEAARVTLELAGFEVDVAADGQAALERLSPDWPGIVITDVKMPKLDGLELLSHVTGLDPELPVILVTGHGDVPMALDAVRRGAYDFIEKPVAPERLIEVAGRALKTRTLIRENRELRTRLSGGTPLENRILGHSEPMIHLRRMIETLANVDVDVLVHGETGTGKELVARALHDLGPRGAGRFVAVNCGGLPESVIESELFGHEQGAFTGAVRRRIGKLELANGGTLFLDEVETMPLHIQAKLLRVLQERTLERLGGNDIIGLNLRVVSATKTDLAVAAEQGAFRDDLYYRLSVARLDIPPLRSRLSDLPALFIHFVDQESRRIGREPPAVESDYLRGLLSQAWKGNVRELRNHAQRFILGLDDRRCEPGRHGLDAQLVDFERRVIETALANNNGRISDTADELGIPRKRLYLRMRRFGLDRTDYRQT